MISKPEKGINIYVGQYLFRDILTNGTAQDHDRRCCIVFERNISRP